MPRPLRCAEGGLIYHVLNRANARLTLFRTDDEYDAFERVLAQAVRRTRMRLLAYCVMPNHWHLVVWPQNDGDLSRFAGWLAQTHTQRHHAEHDTIGEGSLYQGRFKSFPVQEDGHLLRVCRYVERNALRAGLVRRAEDWTWSSIYRRQRGSPADRSLLTRWPVAPGVHWVAHVNEPHTEAELQAMRNSVVRGTPLGQKGWCHRVARALGLESTLRGRGRPAEKKGSDPFSSS